MGLCSGVLCSSVLRIRSLTLWTLLVGAVLASGQTTQAPLANPPTAHSAEKAWPVQEGTVELKNFRFQSGESLPTLRLHYLTLGQPHRDAQGHTDNAVLLLHGTGGNARSLLNPAFSNVLFPAGGTLDSSKYFLILPDDIGHGQSSKPSDGLHARFPAYDYDDMVRSQRMMLEAMKVDHLRLILGTSMGCMQSFVWGETYGDFVDALAPFACLPVEIAGRNRMMRYMAIEAVKRDPAWQGGEYRTQPASGMRTAEEILLIMGSSPLQMQKNEATRQQAETYVDTYLKRGTTTDANDLIYYMNASRNYDPSAKLEKIQTPVLWINSADDLVNPPELGIAEKMVGRMPHARFILVPISDQTRGHGTHTQARVWNKYLAEFMRETERKP